MKRILVFFVFPLLLFGCSTTKRGQYLQKPERALSLTSILTHQPLTQATITRAAPILGLHATIFVAKYVGVSARGALDGIAQQAELLSLAPSPPTNEGSTFAILERMGEILRTDVVDLLNRGTNRTLTFDAYIDNLQKNIEQSSEYRMLLDTELENIKQQLRTKKNERRSAEKELKNILKEQDFARVGTVKQGMTSLEEEEAILSIREDELKEMSEILENLVEQGRSRLQTLEQNREFLIAGLRVPTEEELQKLLPSGKVQNPEQSRENPRDPFGLSGL